MPVNEAAERLIEHERAMDSGNEDDSPYAMEDGEFEWDMCENDEQLVLKHALAAHDPTPVDEASARRLGFRYDKDFGEYMFLGMPEQKFDIRYYHHNGNFCFVDEDEESVVFGVKTIGQLTSLISALKGG
jgi:hypothetical protein